MSKGKSGVFPKTKGDIIDLILNFLCRNSFLLLHKNISIFYCVLVSKVIYCIVQNDVFYC